MTVFADLRALEEEQEDLTHRMAELDPASAEYAQVADRFHQAEGEFRARDGYAIEAQVGMVLSGLGFPQRDWKRAPKSSPAAGRCASRWPSCCSKSPTCCCSTSPPTTSTWKPATGWKSICTTIRTPSCWSRTTAIFSTSRCARSPSSGTRASTSTPAATTRYEAAEDRAARAARSRLPEPADRIEQLEAFINRFRYQATKAKQVQSRIKELERIERIEIPPEEKTIHFRFPQPKPSGRIVAEFQNVAKSYGDQHVFAGVDFIIERGDRVALVGVNGAGKSTLIKMLAGAEPLTGRIHLGHNVQPDYFAQDQYKELDPDARMLDDLATSRRAPPTPNCAASWAASCSPRTMSSSASACSPAASATATRWPAC
jgi:ATP-binding cassette, subfamily F, member 3